MLTFTPSALATLRSYIDDGYLDRPALRVAALPGGSALAPEYEFTLIEDSERDAHDEIVELDGFAVFLEATLAERLRGATVDFVERDGARGFDVRSPGAAAALPAGELAERIQRVLDERVNPGVAQHGGQITLVEERDGVAYVRMSGGCQGCGMARVTLRQGVEKMLREAIPELVGVQDVTDHVAGTTPFYAKDG
jgi:Fe/S biogenesis protein NfuA